MSIWTRGSGVALVAAFLGNCVPAAKINEELPLTGAVQVGIANGSKTFDHSVFDDLLRKHAKADGRVDYVGIQKDHAQLKSYLSQLHSADLSSLSREELLALLINAYNAYTLDLIVRNYPIESIKRDLSAPWDTKFVEVGGVTVTLNDIEHTILRPVELFDDPRMHFAINCASIGCPPLRSSAYTGAGIERELDEAVRQTLAQPRYLEVVGDGVQVSEILDWFKGDFEKKYGSLRSFLTQHTTGRAREILAKDGSIGFQEYDWNLNDLPRDR